MKYIKTYEKFKNNFIQMVSKSDDDNDIPESDKKREIEDLVNGVTDDGWEILKKRYYNQSGSYVYEFKLATKSVGYLWPSHRENEKFYNSYIFDNEVKEIIKSISHSELNRLGYKSDVTWYADYGNEGYWDSGVYKGQLIYKAYILLKVIEPSWCKEKSKPYKEISDKESGIT